MGVFCLLLAGSLWHKWAPIIGVYGIRLLAQATLWSSRPMRVEYRWTSTNESGEHWAELFVVQSDQLFGTNKAQWNPPDLDTGTVNCLKEFIQNTKIFLWISYRWVQLIFCVFYKIPGRKWKMMIKSPESIHQHIICWENYGWRLVLSYNLG